MNPVGLLKGVKSGALAWIVKELEREGFGIESKTFTEEGGVLVAVRRDAAKLCAKCKKVKERCGGCKRRHVRIVLRLGVECRQTKGWKYQKGQVRGVEVLTYVAGMLGADSACQG